MKMKNRSYDFHRIRAMFYVLLILIFIHNQLATGIPQRIRNNTARKPLPVIINARLMTADKCVYK